jgi:phage terminase large subunit
VDVIGIGAGVVDRLNEFEELKGIQIVGVNSSLRWTTAATTTCARAWRDGKDWLDPKNGPVSIPNDQELQTDLTSLHYSYRGGELLIESKEDAKKRGIKSPDRADSLTLTFAEPVSPIDLLPRAASAAAAGEPHDPNSENGKRCWPSAASTPGSSTARAMCS